MKYMTKEALTREELVNANKANSNYRIRREIKLGRGSHFGKAGTPIGPAVMEGKIYQKGDISKFVKKELPDMPTFLNRLKAKEIANRLVYQHEVDELKAIKGNFAGHNSSSVILREHNNVTKLKGNAKDVNQVQKFVSEMREFDTTDGRIRRTFPQLGYEHGSSKRLSRHAIKKMVPILNKALF